MNSMQMINSIIEWEKRLEVEETRRKYNHIQPYFTDIPQEPTQPKRSNFFVKLFSRDKKQQSKAAGRKEKTCKDPQPC